MKVVFVEEVEGTANVGEIKDVKNGFARNYLLPRGLAVAATKHNLQRAEKLAKADGIRQDKLDGSAQVVAKKIDGAAITLTARVGLQGRLFGSVGAIDIARELSEKSGTDVEHRQVLLPRAIRTLGTQEVRIRLTRNVFRGLAVIVEPQRFESRRRGQARLNLLPPHEQRGGRLDLGLMDSPLYRPLTKTISLYINGF